MLPSLAKRLLHLECRSDLETIWFLRQFVRQDKSDRDGVVEGFQGMAYSVWGISIATPEALYDLEVGEVTRRLMEKLSAVKEGRDPLLETTNGAE